MLGWSLSIPGAILQRFLSLRHQQLKKKAELLELSSSLSGSDVGRFQDSWRWPAKISSDDSSSKTLSLSHLLQKLLSWWFLQSFRTFSQSLGWAGIPPWGDDLQKDKLSLKLNWVKIPSKTREKRPTLELNWVKISIGDQVRLCYACIA